MAYYELRQTNNFAQWHTRKDWLTFIFKYWALEFAFASMNLVVGKLMFPNTVSCDHCLYVVVFRTFRSITMNLKITRIQRCYVDFSNIIFHFSIVWALHILLLLLYFFIFYIKLNFWYFIFFYIDIRQYISINKLWFDLEYGRDIDIR